jgi:hypothetical protein
MCNTLVATLFALVVSAPSVLAQFEGEVEMTTKVTSKEGKPAGIGTNVMSVSKSGARLEINTQMGLFTFKAAMLWKKDTPNILYRIDDESRTYTEIDLAKAEETTDQKDLSTYVVQKLGQETILGHVTQHVILTEHNPQKANGMIQETWIAAGLVDPELLAKLTGKASNDKARVKALQAAGAEGLPLRAIYTPSNGGKIETEVLRIDKKALPNSRFEVPAGYKATAG